MMTRSESKYEKILKDKYYPDPIVFEKEKKRIIKSLQNQIVYFEGQIDYYYDRATFLRKMIVDNKQQLKELT